MSELVHVVAAGPTLKKLPPAPTTSATAFAPVGVVPSRGGPLANTIGNTGAPFKTTVPLGSRVVTPAAAIPVHRSASASATGQTIRFTANPCAHERHAESAEPTPEPDLQQWAERPTGAGVTVLNTRRRAATSPTWTPHHPPVIARPPAAVGNARVGSTSS